MRTFLPLLAIFAVATVPAAAQTAASQPPAEKPKTVTKIVCERIDIEETTGSRLRAPPKVCKKVEVPVDATDKTPLEGRTPSVSGDAN